MTLTAGTSGSSQSRRSKGTLWRSWQESDPGTPRDGKQVQKLGAEAGVTAF